MSVIPAMTAMKRSADSRRARRMVGDDRAGERQQDDFYPTPPELTDALLAVESFDGLIWEPACGDGALAKRLVAAGHHVIGSDLVDRGYGAARRDFLMEGLPHPDVRHVVTNPPFKLGEHFWRHACAITPCKVAFLARLTWLEGLERAAMFRRYPPARVWIVPWRAKMQRGRLATAADSGGMLAWCWYVRDPLHSGPPALGWCPDTREGRA